MKPPLKIAVTGYRNHPLRLIRLLKDVSDLSEIIVFHPDSQKLSGVDLSSLSPKIRTASQLDPKHLDALLIASPDATHVPYIRGYADRVPYLFCEKPPATNSSDVEFLRSLSPKARGRLYFNFNYRFTELARIAKDCIQTQKIGKPIHFEFTSTHGLAFKETQNDTWRAEAKDALSGVLGTVGIHYLDLCHWLGGALEQIHIDPSTHSPHFKTHDTVRIHLKTAQGCTAAILVSYATSFANTARLIFTDGQLELDNGIVSLYSPRDTFDAQGRFSKPPAKELFRSDGSKTYYDQALKKSLHYFLDTVRQRASFPTESFDLALNSTSAALTLNK